MIPSCFSNLIGNERVKVYLKRIIEHNCIGHSLLFAGPDGVGKGQFALAFASRLIHGMLDNEHQQLKIRQGCHPDIHLYRPEGKLGLHSIQTMRQFAEEVYLPPYEAKWKVFIIHEADRMLSYSANALLKTFEEPPPHTLIILLTASPSALLPTIFSRCRTLYFQRLTQEDIQQFLYKERGLGEEQSRAIAQLAQGSIARALHLAEKGNDEKRSYLFQILSHEGFTTYKALSHAAQTLADQIELIKKQVEKTVKEEQGKIWSDTLSSQQQHLLEKELEGAIAMAMTREVNDLLENLLSWYRDLHLLKWNGNLDHLINKDYTTILEQVGQRGNLPSLEDVSQFVDDMRLAIQRSTALPICFETLFLKLNLI